MSRDPQTILTQGQAANSPWRRRLDAVVAEKVFRLQVHVDECPCESCAEGETVWANRIAPYSTDLTAAGEILTLFDQYHLGKGWDTQDVVHFAELTAFEANRLGACWGWALGDTLPRAICLSALNAIDGDVKEARMRRIGHRATSLAGGSRRMWSCEVPTEPGWYWWRTSPYLTDPDHWDVYRVNERGQILDRDCTVREIKLLCPNSEWAGPLEEPC